MLEWKILKEQLKTVNQSLFYLLLIILSVLFSFWSVIIQREQLEEKHGEGRHHGEADDQARRLFPSSEGDLTQISRAQRSGLAYADLMGLFSIPGG